MTAGAALAAEPAWTYHQVIPEQALAFHRHGVAGTLFRIQGFSELVADPAFNPRLDRHNRYQSYGTVMPDNVLPRSGWDWCLWPGTTTIYHLPESLSGDLRPPQNGQTFVGGSHLDARHGVFAMRFHDVAFDRTFWFNKSVFSFGNSIICLGSDIENHDFLRETVTTLFQTPLPEPTAPIRVNAIPPIQSLRYEQVLEQDEAVWLMDPMGIGYVVPGGQRVQVARRTQLSVNDLGTEEVAGQFATAWLDHGPFPLGAGYEYTILLDATPDAVAAYAKYPQHEVLARTHHTHIVRRADLGLTGYVLFRREMFLEMGPVRGADRPCLILVEESGETLRISVCDPDLSPEPEKAAHASHLEHETGNVVTVVLRGKWDFASEGASDKVKRTDLRPETATFAFEVEPGVPTETRLKARP